MKYLEKIEYRLEEYINIMALIRTVGVVIFLLSLCSCGITEKEIKTNVYEYSKDSVPYISDAIENE